MKEGINIKLSDRQNKIIQIIEKEQPITGESIADKIGLTRATLRPDLAVLSMCGMIDAKPKVGYFLSNKKGNKDILEKLSSIKLSDIKSLPVAVTESTSVYDSIVTIFLENVGTLFVVENDTLKGVVSRKDLLKATMSGGDLSTIPIGVIMTRFPKIVCCTEDETVINAAEKIIENEVDCLPIVEILSNGKMKAIGRVSKTNITKVILDISR
ncbi:CBS domain-containing protein [Sedimentibacter acidaminivorans]|jgi:DeoR family transcriptional regulator, catabolite repression regulator|uniref:CBS domain-containing protein n=1 Tax=Sedimentibacter acidaminivorans TaxID=913099 RepID=A0ABS4GCM2_9FIRM|nr:helix-turn-helix transcriptional regulator [Sedimentibacter acidaminivorans]MBP1925441.1 CBS domain-containing protein [Sedimentibacter acidaminivorans]